MPEYHSILKSLGSNSIIEVDIFSKTATVTVEVWTLPFRSVGGTLCILWPPASLLSSVKSSPIISIETSPDLESNRRCFQPTRVKCLMYAMPKSLTKSLESSPPSAERISKIRFILNSQKRSAYY